jgi:uncharacterized protein
MFAEIQKILWEFWVVFVAMAPWLLLGFGVAGIMSVLITPAMMERHLGKRSFGSILKASLFGVPMPLCSCSVIPVTVSLRRHGASKGAASAFLISTPQTGVDSIAVTYSLLGPVFALARVIVAFVSGFIGGVVIENLDGREGQFGEVDACTASCCSEAGKRLPWYLRMLEYGFVALPRDIGPMLLVGVLIAAGVSVLVPEDFFSSQLGGIMGGSILGMILMMLLGIPVYVCATASVPIAAMLVLDQGVSPGTALVFLMTGPATNAASLMALAKVFGWKSIIAYVLTIAVCAIASGLALDAVLGGLDLELAHQGMKMGPDWIAHAMAVALLVLLVYATITAKKHKHDADDEHAHEDHDHGHDEHSHDDHACCDHDHDGEGDSCSSHQHG